MKIEVTDELRSWVADRPDRVLDSLYWRALHNWNDAIDPKLQFASLDPLLRYAVAISGLVLGVFTNGMSSYAEEEGKYQLDTVKCMLMRIELSSVSRRVFDIIERVQELISENEGLNPEDDSRLEEIDREFGVLGNEVDNLGDSFKDEMNGYFEKFLEKAEIPDLKQLE